MSLTLSTGNSAEIELVGGDFVRWKDVSRHANKKACKPWAQLVTGAHEKYGVDGEWLSKQTIDGDVAFDTSDLTPGDYIKVSGASHSNKKHAYYQVDSVDESLTITRVSESDVLESVRSSDDLDECDNCDRSENTVDRTAVVSNPHNNEQEGKTLALCSTCARAFDMGAGNL